MFIAAPFALLTALASAQPSFPAEAPEDWVLAIVDVETTGLDPVEHELIDIGAIYATVNGEELGRFFIRVRPDHPERAAPQARAVNGYSPERWEALGAVSEAEAAARFLAFHDEMTQGRHALFTAYNAYFDRSFLDAFLRQHGSSFRAHFSYFILDLPSLAWGAGIRDLKNADVAARFGLPAETDDPLQHTGLSGVEWNLALYRAIAHHGDASEAP